MFPQYIFSHIKNCFKIFIKTGNIILLIVRNCKSTTLFCTMYLHLICFKRVCDYGGKEYKLHHHFQTTNFTLY